MKKKHVYKRISNYLILDNWDLVGNILLKIINESLKTGIFPDSWKESLVTLVVFQNYYQWKYHNFVYELSHIWSKLGCVVHP